MLTPRLTDSDVLQERLARAGVTARREAGQHFLISEEVVEATVASLRHWKDTAWRITELGAGVGTLTQALAGAGAEVRAIEREVALAQLLTEHIPRPVRKNVSVVVDDLRSVEWTWTAPYLLVGNIPYNLSGLILRRLTQLTPAPEAAVFLVQQEVAERVAARPPDMSLLGLAVQLWGTATILLHVPRSCFWPEPKVNSALVVLVPHEPQSKNNELVLKIARPFFQAKRKQMGGVAQRTLKLAADEVAARFVEAEVGMKQRPQELSPEAWEKLANVLYRKRI